MRILFIVIVLGALGYLGWVYKDEITSKIKTATQQEAATPAPAVAPAPGPGDSQIATPGALPTPATAKRIAPEGVFYVTERVSVQLDVGVKALSPGEEVKLLYRNADGTAKVAKGKENFLIKQSQLTNDLDVAARVAAKH